MYKGNREYKIEGPARDPWGLNGDGRFEIRYDKAVMNRITRHRRNRDKLIIQIYCKSEANNNE